MTQIPMSNFLLPMYKGIEKTATTENRNNSELSVARSVRAMITLMCIKNVVMVYKCDLKINLQLKIVQQKRTSRLKARKFAFLKSS